MEFDHQNRMPTRPYRGNHKMMAAAFGPQPGKKQQYDAVAEPVGTGLDLLGNLGASLGGAGGGNTVHNQFMPHQRPQFPMPAPY